MNSFPAALKCPQRSQRFWSKVDKTDRCWIWKASKGHGYGAFGFTFKEGKRLAFRAHRISYEDQHGPIPLGLEIDHLCRNRSCVRPSHMEPVTHQENVRRGWVSRGIIPKEPRPKGPPREILPGDALLRRADRDIDWCLDHLDELDLS